MNNTSKNKDLKSSNQEKLEWDLIQTDMKNKLGLEIFESWLKKISFVYEFNNYILLSVPTRFIRDWITSRYLDQILQTVKNYKKEIIRIEFKIIENQKKDKFEIASNEFESNENISFIKDSFLQILGCIEKIHSDLELINSTESNPEISLYLAFIFLINLTESK